MFGKVMSVSDELMWRYFSLILCDDDASVAAARENIAAGRRHPRDVKDELGRRIVARFHDEAAAREASTEFARVFQQKQLPTDMPEVPVGPDHLEEGRIGILNLLVLAGLATSNSEARRLVQQGAVRIDEEKISDPRHFLAPADGAVIRCGKRGFARVKLA